MDSHKFLIADADCCVMCGMCLTHCPTYLKTLEEGESPRGRIALLMALAKGELAPSPRLQFHLNRCLVCRACERICPSGVPYGRIIDAGRALLVKIDPPSPPVSLLRRSLLNGLIGNPQHLHAFGWILYAIQRLGLMRLAPLFGLGKFAELLPTLPQLPPFLKYYPARNFERGRVALFTGCVSSIMDRATLEAAIKVLTYLGYSVEVPKRQVCCGALHLHNGDPEGAQRLMQRNLEVFSATGEIAIVTTASGCGATLLEYPSQKIANNNEEILPLARRIVDISEFLIRIPWSEEVKLRPLRARVAIHDPCSMTNIMRQSQAPYTLLRRIPNITVIPLPGNQQCCGGAGTALINESSLTRSLQTDKIAALREIAPDILVTSNLGCALHLIQGTRRAGIDLEIIHPITLLARQLAY